MPADAKRAHVLMLVGADVTVDARVQKTAKTLTDVGCQVTVLFFAKQQRDFPTHLGQVRIEQVPTTFTHVPPPWWAAAADAGRVLRTRGGYANLSRRRRAVHRRKLNERSTASRIVERKLAMTRLHQEPGRSVSRRIRRKLKARLLTTAITAERLRLRVWRRIQRARIARTELPSSSEEFPLQPATDLTRRDHRRDWRRALPDLADLELSFGPRIDALAPDVIHAHDYHLLPAAVEASARARASGRTLPVIYDVHEWVRGLTTLYDERRRALAAMEARFVPRVDAVICVSPALADQLVADHGCQRPSVVLNAPYLPTPERTSSRSLRQEAGVGHDDTLVVYSGNVTPARGVHTLVDAIPYLTNVHVVLVVGDRVRYLDQLLDRAEGLGVADRLHLAPYVPADEVPAYLAQADVGVHPLRRYPNGEIALPNKLFEYVQAGIPVVVSDCAAQAAFVREQKLGAVFRAGDPRDLARVVTDVLAEPARYRADTSGAQRADLSWEGQEPALLDVYRQLLKLPADAS